MKSETEFYKQCLIDELNNKPVISKYEKEMHFVLGAVCGMLIGTILTVLVILTK